MAIAPTVPKVKAAGYGGGFAGLVSQALIWLLGAWVWGAGFSAGQVEQAYAAVPAPLTALITAVVAGAGAWAAGYITPSAPPQHTIQGTDIVVTQDGEGGDHRA